VAIGVSTAGAVRAVRTARQHGVTDPRQLLHAICRRIADGLAACYSRWLRFDTLDIIDDNQMSRSMNAITIQQTLLDCGEARVVLANDAACRPVVGVSLAACGAGEPAFVQIDRVTMLELERGTVDLRTVLTDRCAGIALQA
jgi:hypothetical protein